MIQIFQEMNAFYWIIGVAAFTSICLLVYLMVNAFKDDEPEQPKEKPKERPIAGGESIEYPSTHTIIMEAPKRDVPKHVKYRKNVKINTSTGIGGAIIFEEDDTYNDEGIVDVIDDAINATMDLNMSIPQSDNTYVPDSSTVDTYVPDSSPSYSPDPSPSVQDSWSSSPSFDSSSSHSSYDSGSSSSYDSGSSSSSSFDSSSSSSSFDSGSSW